ncbi:MAG: methyltransferase domain-containing protein [Alphaproteobacteria bacterium]|nr:methyltransferase domain-containing protein [Alphaproteobacteria bacterium]
MNAKADINVAINRFYETTKLDYYAAWMFRGYPHYHFGYFAEPSMSHRRASLRMTELVCELAQPKPGEAVLDAGCGRGGTSIWLAQNCGVEVTGICLSETMIRSSRRRARRAGVETSVTFQNADMAATGFPDASFDVIVALESASHTLGPAAICAEFRRLLRPGGRIVVADYIVNSSTAQQASSRVRRWQRNWHLYGLASRSEHLAAAEANELELSHWQDVSVFVAPSVKRLAKAAARMRQFNAIMNRLRLRNRTQVLSAVAARDMGQAFDLGEWSYALFRLDRQAS